MPESANMSPTLDLACQLISFESMTPDDAGCQAVLANRLSTLGFKTETLKFGNVTNLWATIGDAGPLLVFAGHTDVVPPGPESEWRSAPFIPEVIDGMLHGRGSADMKGSLAAMVTAMESLFAESPVSTTGRIGLLLTSDEEGPAIDGTRKVVAELQSRGVEIKWCVVGEPSSAKQLGDTVRTGRRGSLNGELLVNGKQGHVAYPENASNPIHAVSPALAELCEMTWDSGTDEFPHTTFQISNIASGTGADNVIPGTALVRFNFRYSPASSMQSLQARVTDVLNKHQLDYQLEWRDSGKPFLSQPGTLRDAVLTTIKETLGIETACTTGGGTSDGRFIAPTGAEVIELGPVNATIHKIDEQVAVADLESLSVLYREIARKLVCN